ncbi:MAG: cyclic pyranopterin monophosphate synthase MoaC [Spirochaetales bacterium]|nr:cyclic pyranopterin monophosphate synthase MoaC [Spirochaetales bacterium]
MQNMNHLDKEGKAVMVDISKKPPVRRTALAAGRINLAAETVDLIRQNLIKKGDVLTISRIAGIMAAKKTADFIPLCHNIALEHITVDLDLDDTGVTIRSEARCTDKTGIEMEALTAVTVAALTIYDMCKAVDKKMLITDIRLLEKRKEEL